jgi:hypothetical protein
MYLCLSACLNEFIRALGPQLFEETVIYITGDFNRQAHGQRDYGSAGTPDPTMHTGSEHAPNANVVSLISGAIQEPMVFGNITLTGSQPFGAYGQSSAVNFEGFSRILSEGDQSSTVAALCRAAAPESNTPSLVVEGSNGVTSSIPAQTTVNGVPVYTEES